MHACTPRAPTHLCQTTMLHARVDLRDVQIAALHADSAPPRDGARKNVDRYPNYVVAAYVAAGT